jgi:hypothetical protein
MKRFALVLAIGCVTPYQPHSFTGGYSDRSLGNGRHLIVVNVNAYTSRLTAWSYLYRRANELCPNGFDLVDRTSGDNGDWNNHKPEEGAIVQCRAVRAPRSAKPAGPPLHDPSDDPFKTWSYWCNGGRCTADKARCHGTCVEQSNVWCAVYETKGDETEFSCTTARNSCLDAITEHGQRNGVHGWGECVEQAARLASPPDAPKADLDIPAVAVPRGFFCAHSATVAAASFCVREKAACEAARSAALTAVADLGACTLTEVAWCTGDRCAATQDGCNTQQAGSGGAGECIETK